MPASRRLSTRRSNSSTTTKEVLKQARENLPTSQAKTTDADDVSSTSPQEIPAQNHKSPTVIFSATSELQKALNICGNVVSSSPLVHTFKQLLKIVCALSDQLEKAIKSDEDCSRATALVSKVKAENESLKQKTKTMERFLEVKLQQYDALLKEEQRAVKEMKTKNEHLTKLLFQLDPSFADENMPLDALQHAKRPIRRPPSLRDEENGANEARQPETELPFSGNTESVVAALVTQLKYEKEQRLATEEQGYSMQKVQEKTISNLEQRIRVMTGRSPDRLHPPGWHHLQPPIPQQQPPSKEVVDLTTFANASSSWTVRVPEKRPRSVSPPQSVSLLNSGGGGAMRNSFSHNVREARNRFGDNMPKESVLAHAHSARVKDAYGIPDQAVGADGVLNPNNDKLSMQQDDLKEDRNTSSTQISKDSIESCRLTTSDSASKSVCPPPVLPPSASGAYASIQQLTSVISSRTSQGSEKVVKTGRPLANDECSHSSKASTPSSRGEVFDSNKITSATSEADCDSKFTISKRDSLTVSRSARELRLKAVDIEREGSRSTGSSQDSANAERRRALTQRLESGTTIDSVDELANVWKTKLRTVTS
ncbi:hypothetical protein DIPPA_59171 [Diplonema papillatum]|nr:hypothetical protein DIPPA_59171 [Diplonema papillatum]